MRNYRPTQTTHGSGVPAIALVMAAGLAAVGLGMFSQRRARQLGRAQEFQDNAPLRAQRAIPGARTIVGRAVTINRPRAEIYAFWRDFANLPRFMSNVHQVEIQDGGRSRWTIAAPGGFSVDVLSEITEDRPDERIAWRSLPESDVQADGSVTFRDAPAGRGTIVEAEIAYLPPGGQIGRAIAMLFQREPSIQGRRELKRLKMLMETGEIATSANQREDR